MTLHALAARLQRMLRRESRPPAGSPGVVVHRVEQSQSEVEQYWTDERVGGARPRQVVQPDPRTATDPPEAEPP